MDKKELDALRKDRACKGIAYCPFEVLVSDLKTAKQHDQASTGIEKKILYDLRKDCACEYLTDCLFEGINIDLRTAEQHKCVEIFKWDQGKIDGKDIGWDEAYRRWYKEGYAEIFADVYEPGKHAKEMYLETMLRKKQICQIRNQNQGKSIADKVDSPNQISL